MSKQKYQALESNYAQVQAQKDTLESRTAELEVALAVLESRDPNTAAYYRELLTAMEPLIDKGEILVHLKDDRMSISFRDQINFDFADHTLDPSSERVARELAEHIIDVPWMTFQVEGHTDKVDVAENAEWENNWELGAARAAAVLQVLIDSGVSADRLSLASYGDTEPVRDIPGPVEANRRVVISLQPDLARVDGAEDFAATAAQHDALIHNGDLHRLRPTPESGPDLLITEAPEMRPVEPQMHHNFTIPVVEGDVLRIWTKPGRLNFQYGETLMSIAVADQAEIRGELDRLQREVDDWEIFSDVRGDEIDDEIRALLIEAIDEDTTVWIDGVPVPGNEVDDEIAQYWEEVFDAPGYMTITADEIDDEIEALYDEVNEELREQSN